MRLKVLMSGARLTLVSSAEGGANNLGLSDFADVFDAVPPGM